MLECKSVIQSLPPMFDIMNMHTIIMNTIVTYLMHVESVESVPGFICTPETHLKRERPNHV